MTLSTELSRQHERNLWLDQILQERMGCDRAAIAQFCQRKKIIELSLFGSVLRDDFRIDGDDPSDVDVLVVFAPNDGWTLFDIMDMQRELEVMFGRQVDLVFKDQLENPYRRDSILKTYQVIYAAE